ncbi:polymer-forming cytoskeletal protein [Mixta tenebrionis]|uniref:Polymer-forming cytoskeletal protein n=2 Tax=Mixta tenebrionis TaxID=2562439 RepID=A0A506V8N6_9GAMM|nr:hypothetical protein C7M52_00220 [Mixta theicola]TPW41690.1 polymer-forming cytoskeletal protein [Mixta tenebrionis]
MNYNLLWGIWLSWAVALLAYCLEWANAWELLTWLAIIALTVIAFFITLFLIRTLKSDKGLTMFKRKDNFPESNYEPEKPESIIYPEPPPAPTNKESVSAAIVVDREATIIPSSCHINGEIKASGDMKINGSVDGKIMAEKTVYVLGQGVVEGEIFAAKVVVDGKVKGLCASAVVEINANGLMDGTIESDDLSINKNGRFYGVSKPAGAKKEMAEHKTVNKESGAEKLTMIQQVLDNVQDKM